MQAAPPNTQNRYNFHIPIDTKAQKDDGTFYVEGHISTKDIDLVDDIVEDTAMDSMIEQLKNRNIKLDFEHETLRGDDDLEKELNKTRTPLAKLTNPGRTTKGVKVRAEFNQNWKKFDKEGNVVKTFDEVMEEVQKEFLDAFSIAFYPIPDKTEFTEKDGKRIRKLKDFKLINVALTGNPVNPEATIGDFGTAVAKSMEAQTKEAGTMNATQFKNTMQKLRQAKEHREDMKDDEIDNLMQAIAQGQELKKRQEEILEAVLEAGKEESKSEEDNMELEEIKSKREEGKDLSDEEIDFLVESAQKSEEDDNSAEGKNEDNDSDAKGEDNSAEGNDAEGKGLDISGDGLDADQVKNLIEAKNKELAEIKAEKEELKDRVDTLEQTVKQPFVKGKNDSVNEKHAEDYQKSLDKEPLQLIQ